MSQDIGHFTMFSLETCRMPDFSLMFCSLYVTIYTQCVYIVGAEVDAYG